MDENITATQPEDNANKLIECIVFVILGDSRALQVEGDTFMQAAELLRRSPEFTVLATLKQEAGNAGTIISFSHGYNR